MTNREAIKLLKEEIPPWIKWNGDGDSQMVIKLTDAFNLSIQALEKQEPKLVKGISFTYDGSVGNCPDCNSFVDDRNNSIICKCGQKLLWKEVQDDK